jgi:hypothetical protein
MSNRRDAAQPRLTLSAFYYAVGPVLLACLLGGVLLRHAFGGKQTRFEDLALGSETTSVFAKVDGRPIHCHGIEDAEDCLIGLRERGQPRVALWLGNSQLHAVNQFRPRQETAAAVLFQLLRRRGIDLLTFSEPNANSQEHYVLFEYLRLRMPIELLILPVVFDKFRETGIRSSFAPALSDPETVAALRHTTAGENILRLQQEAPDKESDLAGLAQTTQERSEAALDGWLQRHFELWALRPEARGTLISDLERLRNTVFGITPQSTRKVIPVRYQRNMEALRATLDQAAAAHVHVLVYIVPIRNDVLPPYDLREYGRFKEEIEKLVRERGAVFANFEALVPGYLWGHSAPAAVGSNPAIDFMHFQAPGHRLLADALDKIIREQIFMSHS